MLRAYLFFIYDRYLPVKFPVPKTKPMLENCSKILQGFTVAELQEGVTFDLVDDQHIHVQVAPNVTQNVLVMILPK